MTSSISITIPQADTSRGLEARFERAVAAVGGASIGVAADWAGSIAQAFTTELARQLAVDPSSVAVVDRYGGGLYLVFDIVPVELALSPLITRLRIALQSSVRGVAEVRS